MLALLLLFELGLLLSAAIVGAQSAGRAPNIVFILTDDQDARMHSLRHMPKLQKHLVSEGTSYIRHYAPTALCCPARVSIMTGLHAHNHLVTDVNGPFGGWKQVLARGLNDDYLPIWLRNAGYHTYYTGKLYNGMHTKWVEEKTARGWTQADLLVGSNTYQYNHPPFQHIEGNWNNPGKVKIFDNEYSTNKVADYAYGYLKEAVKKDAPFFVGIAPITPHSQVGKSKGPPVPAKKYKGTQRDLIVPRADNFNPQQRSGVNLVWDLERLNRNQTDMLDHHYRCRTEALLSVDDMVESVVDILKTAGKLDNTYIIYTSDNGFHLGHHRLGAGKKYAFEEDINVPLIIRGPDVPKDRTTDLVSAHVDLSPTILKMAGIEQRKEFDGKPIPFTAAAIQKQEGSEADDYANIEFWTGASYKMHQLKGKRVNSYKSVRLAGKGYDIMYAVQCHKNARELYNMNKDPIQMRNLHPKAPAEQGQKNAFQSGEDKIAGYDIKRLLPRIDALLLVLKSCNRDACANPWKQLHPDGGVKNLRDAMDKKHDLKYHGLPKVRFRKCFKNGTIDLWAEGPQWHPGLAATTGQIPIDTDTSETMQLHLNTPEDNDWNEGEINESETEEAKEEDNSDTDWETEGYWDDWE